MYQLHMCLYALYVYACVCECVGMRVRVSAWVCECVGVRGCVSAEVRWCLITIINTKCDLQLIIDDSSLLHFTLTALLIYMKIILYILYLIII